jgi:hypothetical protein
MSIANALTASIIEYITLKGGLAWRNNTGGYKTETRFIRFGRVGSGDVFAVYRGKFLSIEVKVGRDRLRPAQEEWMEKVEACGGIPVVAKSLDDVIAAIESLCATS